MSQNPHEIRVFDARLCQEKSRCIPLAVCKWYASIFVRTSPAPTGREQADQFQVTSTYSTSVALDLPALDGAEMVPQERAKWGLPA
jgi:hypothetical protein